MSTCPLQQSPTLSDGLAGASAQPEKRGEANTIAPPLAFLRPKITAILPPLDLGGAVLVLAAVSGLVAAIAAVFVVPSLYPKFPIDAYYYLEMARNVAMGHGPTVRFEQGVAVKFFPGYPLLLGVLSLWLPPHVTWPALHALLLLALFAAIIWAGRLIGVDRSLAWATAALVFAQPVFLKWVTLPYAELLTVLLGVGLVPFVMGVLRQPGVPRFLAAGLVAGFALLSRPTAAFYGGVAIVVFLGALGRGAGLLRLSAFCLGWVGPLAVYLLWRASAGTHPLPYWSEFLTRPPDAPVINRFSAGLVSFAAVPKVAAGRVWLELALTFCVAIFLMAMILALRGYLGRFAFGAAAMSCGFLLCHSLWTYSSERFIVPVLPPAMLALARLLEWLTDQTHTADSCSRPRRLVFALAIALWCLTWWSYTPAVIEDHVRALHQDTGRPHEMAQLANSNTRGAAWIEIGPEFAYFYEGRTYFDHDEPFFFLRAKDKEPAVFRELCVQWIVTRLPADEWLKRHPEIAKLGVQLRRETDDGVWTLYRVLWPKDATPAH